MEVTRTARIFSWVSWIWWMWKLVWVKICNFVDLWRRAFKSSLTDQVYIYLQLNSLQQTLQEARRSSHVIPGSLSYNQFRERLNYAIVRNWIEIDSLDCLDMVSDNWILINDMSVIGWTMESLHQDKQDRKKERRDHKGNKREIINTSSPDGISNTVLFFHLISFGKERIVLYWRSKKVFYVSDSSVIEINGAADYEFLTDTGIGISYSSWSIVGSYRNFCN